MAQRLVDGVLVDVESGTPIDLEEMFIAPDRDATQDTPAEIPMNALTCRNCGKSFTHTGRGRKPYNCPDCREDGSLIGASRKSRPSGFRREAALREALIDRYMGLSFIPAMLGNLDLAASIRDNAEKCADADIAYAQTNMAFRKFLEGLVEKSAAAGVIAAHGQMFAPIIQPLVGPLVGKAFGVKQNKPESTIPQPESTIPQAQRPSSNPFSGRPRPTRPQPPQNGHVRIPDNVDAMFPGEHEGAPEKMPESINAGAIPGMPGF